jgi:hypothetical protein
LIALFRCTAVSMCTYLCQNVVSIKQLKDQLTEYPFTDFLDSRKGYSPISSSKKLVAHFERMQNQQNLSEEKVGISTMFESACI